MKNLFTRVVIYTTVAIILSYIIPCEAGTTDDGSDKVLPVRPYVDPSQMDVPWPKHSHVKQPWRGFLETKPAVDLLEGIGICYHHHGGNLEVQLALLAKAGIRCIRWEQPFGTYDPDIGALAKHSEDRYREVLQACKKLGITPVILLNAHHGVPCKLKSFDRTVMADAPKSSTELLLNSVEGLRPVHSGTNGLTQYWAGEVLFTEVDNVRKAVRLSKPLPKALKKGERLNCVDLYYLPLHPVGTPEFEHTSDGWVDYARSVCRVAMQEGVKIEIEIWNELSFGSYFFGGNGINSYWPGRAKYEKDFLNPGGHAWEVANRTVRMVRKEFPDVRVIWGFSNTTFFHCPISKLPPGIDGQSYHPYGTGWRKLPEREQGKNEPHRCLEQHCPDYQMVMAEGWAHTFIQCESLMHHLRPDKRLTVKPEGTETFHHYITEHGIVPAEAGVTGDDASLRLKQKFLVRAILFWLNKGLTRITIFQAGPEEHDHGMAISLSKARQLRQLPPDTELDQWLSPALQSLRRTVRVFDGAVPISQPRAFDVEVDKLGLERKVFEMPSGKRTLYFRDLFALLPFQVNERKFVFAYYVVSPTYSAEDLKDVVYRVKIHPVDGNSCKVSCYDPLTDSSVKIRIRDRSTKSLTIDLSTVDTPRLLVLEE